MSEQRISVDTCPIDLVLVNGSRISGETFLHLQGAFLDGPQRVGELLNGDDCFLPVRNQGRVELVNLEQVVSVCLAAEKELDPLVVLGTEYLVRVEPLVGEVVDARIFVNLPGGSTRVKDFLNQKKRFLLFLDGDKVIYLARRRIVRVAD